MKRASPPRVRGEIDGFGVRVPIEGERAGRIVDEMMVLRVRARAGAVDWPTLRVRRSISGVLDHLRPGEDAERDWRDRWLGSSPLARRALPHASALKGEGWEHGGGERRLVRLRPPVLRLSAGRSLASLTERLRPRLQVISVSIRSVRLVRSFFRTAPEACRSQVLEPVPFARRLLQRELEERSSSERQSRGLVRATRATAAISQRNGRTRSASVSSRCRRRNNPSRRL